jgi:ribosomal protein S18 acetylase RimI-like enzyme
MNQVLYAMTQADFDAVGPKDGQGDRSLEAQFVLKSVGALTIPERQTIRHLLFSFFNETTPDALDPDALVETALTSSRLVGWKQNPDIRAMALVIREGPEFVSLGGVYAPPAHRGAQGGRIAESLCLSLCRYYLRDAPAAERKARVSLFADAANARSNRFYQKLGFQRVGEQIHLTFSQSLAGLGRAAGDGTEWQTGGLRPEHERAGDKPAYGPRAGADSRARG